MSRPNVLCISFDETVSRMRRAALEEAGYKVTALTKVSEAMNRKPEHFELVILGHRLESSAKAELIDKARLDWKAKVILVCGASNDPEFHPDARVYGLEGIQGIVEAAQKLVPTHTFA